MPYRTPTLALTRSTTLRELATASLLAATGGLLDAITYLDHGHVFANAMTGNLIFLGISALSRDWHDVLLHLAPILAFLAGVFAARLLNTASVRHSALLALAIELIALFAVGLFPASFPQLAFTTTVALASALQVTTFRRVGRFTYNSTFVTGNLREVGEGLFDQLPQPGSCPALPRPRPRPQALLHLCRLPCRRGRRRLARPASHPPHLLVRRAHAPHRPLPHNPPSRSAPIPRITNSPSAPTAIVHTWPLPLPVLIPPLSLLSALRLALPTFL